MNNSTLSNLKFEIQQTFCVNHNPILMVHEDNDWNICKRQIKTEKLDIKREILSDTECENKTEIFAQIKTELEDQATDDILQSNVDVKHRQIKDEVPEQLNIIDNPSEQLCNSRSCNPNFEFVDIKRMNASKGISSTNVLIENINQEEQQIKIETNKNYQKKKNYECNICFKKFNHGSYMKTHKMVHFGVKPYVCDVCNQGFTDNSNLISHKRVHSEEKPFVCPICNKRFSQNGHLKSHNLIHTGEKPCVCDICNTRFKHNNSLVKHKRIHTGEKPYVCDVCSQTFTTNSNLKRHSRIHTDEKPYECGVCSKRFIRISQLKTHTNIHTGERPFICKFCNQGFSHSSKLQRHTLTHDFEPIIMQA